MFKKCYVISGSKEGKEIYRDVQTLNVFQFILMKHRLNKWNHTHPSVFTIENIEKRRIRA